jgi:non-ribosomal peptide synthetase component F
MFAGFVAVVAAAIGTWCSREDVVLMSPMNLGRDDTTRKLCGNLGNLMPLRVSLAGDPSFADLLSRARQDVTTAISSSTVPASLVYRMLDFYRSPFARIILNTPQLDNEPEAPPPVQLGEGLTADMENVRKPYGMRTDLVVRVFPYHGRIRGAVWGNAALFERETMMALADRITRIIAGADSQVRLSALTSPQEDRAAS